MKKCRMFNSLPRFHPQLTLAVFSQMVKEMAIAPKEVPGAQSQDNHLDCWNPAPWQWPSCMCLLMCGRPVAAANGTASTASSFSSTAPAGPKTLLLSPYISGLANLGPYNSAADTTAPDHHQALLLISLPCKRLMATLYILLRCESNGSALLAQKHILA